MVNMKTKRIILNGNQKNPVLIKTGSAGEGSPFFQTESTESRLLKVHNLVTNKDWQIRPACKFHSVSESTYNRFRQKLEKVSDNVVG